MREQVQLPERGAPRLHRGQEGEPRKLQLLGVPAAALGAGGVAGGARQVCAQHGAGLHGQHQNVLEQIPEHHIQDSIEEEFDIELGLGDFFWYSLLIGKVCVHGNWIVILSCFIVILVGLSVTFVLFTIKRKAVPALPIPLSLGLITY